MTEDKIIHVSGITVILPPNDHRCIQRCAVCGCKLYDSNEETPSEPFHCGAFVVENGGGWFEILAEYSPEDDMANLCSNTLLE